MKMQKMRIFEQQTLFFIMPQQQQSNFHSNVISKRIKLETWDCAQMKVLSSSYWLVISCDPLYGYLGCQI